MYEFFTIVDELHDDPTIFPVLSAPWEARPFEWEDADGSTPVEFSTKKITVSRFTGNGWTRTNSFTDLTFTVSVTDARVVVHCQKFVKGGGWRGFGLGGLAVAAVANAVSHARAAARRKGKLLVAQVRYPWLQQVTALRDKKGRYRAIRLVVDAGEAGQPHWIGLEIGMPPRSGPADYARLVCQLAAHARLSTGQLDAAERATCAALAEGPSQTADPHWEIPGAIVVGAPGSLPGAAPVTTVPREDPPWPAGPAASVEPAAPAEPVDPAATVARSSLATPPPVLPPVPTPRAGACSACGAALSATARACGRCGQAVAVAAEHVPPVTPPPVPPPSVPPPPVRPPPLPGGYRANGALPVEVALVAVAMVALGGLLLYPFLRYGFPAIGHLASGNAFVRSLDALITYLLVLLAAAGVALVALAVGLVKGSRVAQLITCIVCGVLVLSEAVNTNDQLTYARTGSGVRVWTIVICLVVIGLLCLPRVRAFFVDGGGRPLGVDSTAAIALYFGSCAVINGLLLTIVGALGQKYVWFGLALVAAGIAMILMGRPLRAGRPAARLAVSVAFVGYTVLGFVVLSDGVGDATSPSALIPLFVSVAALGALWLTPASQQYFQTPHTMPAMRPAGVAAVAIVAVAAVVLAGVGFHSASSSPFGSDYASSYEPDYSAPSDSTQGSPPAVDEDAARAAADTLFTDMEGQAEAVATCDGTTAPLAVRVYAIDDVTEQSTGTFLVSATVNLDDGSQDTVTVLIGTGSDGTACAEDGTIETTVMSAPTDEPSASADTPSDVPSVPSSGDPVPTDAALPDPPQNDALPYDSTTTPTTEDEIVEYEPADLDDAQSAAVADVISFMAHINQQDFDAAWDDSTDSLLGASATSAFRRGFRTSSFRQVAFGEPEQVADDLIVIPARFVSRQDPAAQGSPAGVTDCTLWPQYVFVVADVDGTWLDDVAGTYASRPELRSLKRPGDDGTAYLNPVAQRVAC